jgi:hypothetical protein
MKPGINNINNKKNMPQPLMEGSKPKTYIPKANQSKTKLINLTRLITSATSKFQDLMKEKIKPEIKKDIKTINRESS